MAYPCRSGRYGDPDLTNLEKGVEDALQGVIFTNDKWVAAKKCMKVFCPAQQHEGVRIRVWEIET